ncbi:Aldo-keto reductase yakc [NADP(+)] [Leucoagaricus sp. SymC.cos]|nr:Aldo-keto reductase yakc [NADP(+)] [Leucoagaricus sp. SymC.cos]
MATIPTRKIGNDDVAAIGLGLMGLSAFYGQVESDEERFKFLDVALEEGATFWDTADVYGDSEDLVGKWLKRTGNRNKIFLATKFGFVVTETGRGVNGKPEYAKSACAKSLKRLGVEQIDLYYLHRADPTVPIEPADPSMINRQKTVSAMAELVKEGKVRYLGLSEVSSATLRRAHAVHPITAVQVEYSPFTLDIEDDKIALFKMCRELGVAVIAYSPLGRGLLTGQYKSPDDFEEGDFRRGIPKFSSKENFTKILQLVDGLAEIGKKYNATAGQIALSWVFAQGKDIIPIPGTKKIKYLKENLASVHIKLTDEDERKIRKLAEDSEIMGQDRYPPDMQANIFVDTVPL